MIIGTTSFSLPQRPQRPAAPENAPAAPATDTPDERQKAASGALEALRSIVENGPLERKAQAEEKLKRLKEEMTALMRWGFAPGVTAQRSLHLAKELSSAAAQFSDAISAGKNMQSAFNPAGATPDTSADQQEMAEKAAEYDGRGRAEISMLPQSYRDILNDDAPDGLSGNKETVADFRSVAQQLQFMLEDATRKLHNEGRSGAFTDQAKESLARLDQTLSGLDGTSAGVASRPAQASILLL